MSDDVKVGKKKVLRYDQLVKLQSLTLEEKVIWSKSMIREWYEHWEGKVFISFSGGRDSSVLLHLVRSMYPEVPAMFVDTGMGFPECKELIRNTENVEVVRPKHSFLDVIKKYGYPVAYKDVAKKIHEIRTTKSEKLLKTHLEGKYKLPDKWMYLLDAPFKISSQCCDVMKKNPMIEYEKRTGRYRFIGTMVYESRLRMNNYLQKGCNSFDSKHPVSKPISFWLKKDILEYIKINNVPESEIYKKGFDQTGCVYCAFGLDKDDPMDNRFMKLKRIHPRLYKFCMDTVGMRRVLEWMGYDIDCRQMGVMRGLEDVIDERCTYCDAIGRSADKTKKGVDAEQVEDLMGNQSGWDDEE